MRTKEEPLLSLPKNSKGTSFIKHFLVQIFCTLVSVPLWSNVNQNNDVQLWITDAIHKEISPTTTLHISNEWRFGDDMSKLYFFYLQGITSIEMNQWISLSPGYRQIWHLQQTQWRLAFEPLIDLTFKKKRGNFTFNLRNRFSYLFREQNVDFFQYRARAELMSSFKIIDHLFKPYFANEVFLDSHYGFTQDRLSLGLITTLYKCLSGDFYYMFRFLKLNTDWTHQHIIGTRVNCSF